MKPSAPTPKTSKPRSFLRRWVRRFAFLLIGLVAIAVLLYLFRGPLLSKPLANRVAKELSASLNGTFTIDRIEGSWFSDVVIVGLKTVEAPKSGSIRELSLERARLTYGFTELFGDPLSALKSAEIEGAHLTVDLLAEPEVDDEEPFSLSRLEQLLPKSFPQLAVQDSSVRFLAGDKAYAVSDIRLEGSGDSLLLTLGGIEVPSDFPVTIPESAQLAIKRTAPLEVEVAVTPAIAGLDLRKVVARVHSDDTFSGSVDATLFGSALVASTAQNKLEWSLTRLDLTQLPAWLKSYAPTAPWPTSGTLSVSGQWDTQDPDLNVEIKVAGEAVHIHTVTDLNVNADLAVNGDRITVRGFEATAEGSRVNALALTVSPSHPLVVTEAQDLDIRIPDVRALLTSFGMSDDDIPWPRDSVAVNFRIQKSDDLTIRIEQGRITSGTSEIELLGTLTPNPDPALALQSGVDLTFVAELPDLKSAMFGLPSVPVEEGMLTLRGTLRGSLASPTATAEATGTNLLVRGVRTKDIAFRAKVAEDVIQIEGLKSSGDWGRIEGSGKAQLRTQELVDVALVLTVEDLSAMESLLRNSPEWGGRAALNVQLNKDAGPWDAGYRGVVTGTASNLTHRSQPLGEATLAVTTAWPLITRATLDAEGPLGEIRIAATGDLTDFSDLALDITTLEGSVPDISAFRAWIPDLQDRRGSVIFSGKGDKNRGMPWIQARSEWQLRVAGIEGRGLPVIDSGEIVVLTQEGRITIQDLSAQGPLGQVQLAGMALVEEQGGRVELDQLRANVKDHPVLLRDPIKIAWTKDGRVEVPEFALDVFRGTLTGSLWHDETQRITLKGSGLDLSALPLPEDLEGRLDFELSALGDPKRPLADLTVSIAELRARGETASLQLRASQTADALVLSDLTLSVGTSTTVKGLGRVEASVGTEGLLLPATALADAEVSIQITSADLPLLHRLGLPSAASFASLDADLRLLASAWTFEGKLAEPVWHHPKGPEKFTSQLLIKASGDPSESKFQVTAVPDQGFTLKGTGVTTPGILLRDPTQIPEALLASALRGTATITVPSLARFRTFVPDMRTLEGALAVDLRVEGTVGAPQPTGTMHIRALELKMGNDLPSMTDGDLTAQIAYPRITIEPFTGQLGYGPFRLTGTADLPVDGAPLTLDLAMEGTNLLLARSQHLRVRSDLDLTIKGALEALKVAGTVTLGDVLFSKPIELTASSAPTAPDNGYQLFSFRDPPLSGLEFDVRILADRTIRLSNNLIRGDISSDMRLRGTGSVPKPEGRAFFSDLRVQLPFSRLTVERGDFVFEPNAPFSPRLAITAKTRMRGYDMEIQVSGRLPDTRIQISSEPHLTQQDALALLTLGATPSGLQQEGLSRAALTRVGSLMADGVLSGLMGETDPDAESIADRVSLEVGRDVSRTGSSTIEFEFELRPELFLRAERDKYDAYNMGAIWRWRFR